ncbi:MAG: hypothetical protein KDK36_20905, partial [Leptospiraceae bacterium]|nr:hypothetical protein [Leptospiraceae bacterium]
MFKIFKKPKLKRKINQLGSIPMDKYNEFNVIKNWRRFPRFAIVVFVSAFLFLLQHLFDPKTDRDSSLYSIYIYLYSGIIFITFAF